MNDLILVAGISVLFLLWLWVKEQEKDDE